LKTHSSGHPAPTAPPASFLRLYPTASQTALASMDHVEMERFR
jgi:hypothetical protein